MRKALCGIAVAAVMGLAGGATAATLTPIKPYVDSFGGSTLVNDINGAGWMTGTIVRPDNSRIGFIRDAAGVYTTFEYGPSTWGRSIDDANNVAIWVTGPGSPYGVQWDRAADGASTVRINPDTGLALLGIPGATNASGQQVGDFRYPVPPGQRLGYILDGDDITALSVPGANLTAARGINDAGDVVGFYAEPGADTNRAFLLRGGAFILVDHPDGVFATYLQDINNSGMAAGSWMGADGVRHPFLYDTNTGVFDDIDVPDGLSLNAWGIDNKGRVIVSSNDGLYGAVSFLYDPNGVPEPQAWALMILGFGLAGAGLRRARSALAA